MARASNDGSRIQSRWVDLLDCYPVLEALAAHLTVADFLVLCQTCKGFSGLKDSILRKVSNINHWLRDFMDDPAMFRVQLRSSGALITGSFALNVFELGPRAVPKLDVFVQDGVNAGRFIRYIREHEGYRSESAKDEPPPAPCVYSRSTRPEVKLRVTRTSGSPIGAILTSSRTTAHLNVITWNKAYSIFPRHTLIDHRFYLVGALDDDSGSVLSEISQQGWTTRDIIWPDSAGAQAREIAGLRRVGDKSTLVIPLEAGLAGAPSIPDSVVEYAQFAAIEPVRYMDIAAWPQPQHQPRPPAGLFLKIEAREIASPALRHTYTTASAGWSSTEWFGYVVIRLNRWAWLELYKLKPADRPYQPPTSTQFISDVSIPQGFKRPQSWDYADDQIPQWYREWEQTRAGRV